MPGNHKFIVELIGGKRKGRTHGVLSINAVKEKKLPLRSIVRVTGVKKRIYGQRQSSAVEAARSVLSLMTKKINGNEIDRVLVAVQAVHGASTSVSDLSHPKCVQIIHQIYGVLRDDKPMPQLCQESLREWRRVARIMGAIHYLWNANELDALVKHWYPQFWSMYQNAAFSVMRAHIGRIAILHRFGGLYADLHVLPNRHFYPEAKFAVQKIFFADHQTVLKKWAPVKTNSSRAYSTASGIAAGSSPKPVRKHNKPTSMYPVMQKANVLAMNVLIAEKGNLLLLRWLSYMQTRIHELNYANNAHHATGPKCLQKFLRAKDNVAVRKSLQVLSCNNCAAANRLGVYAKNKYDVISYKSDLDYGERHPSHTSGGHIDDVPKLAAALTEHRRKTLSEAAHPHPARRLRTKSSAAIMTTVSSAHMES